MFVFFFRLLVLMAIWGRLQGLSGKVKLKFWPGWMSPLITFSSFIFPNSLISCCYCYFARVTLLSQSETHFSFSSPPHFFSIPPHYQLSAHNSYILYLFFWIFSLTFLFSLFIFWIFFLTLCAPLF